MTGLNYESSALPLSYSGKEGPTILKNPIKSGLSTRTDAYTTNAARCKLMRQFAAENEEFVQIRGQIFDGVAQGKLAAKDELDQRFGLRLHRPMFKAQTDKSAKLLRISFTGSVDPDEAKRCVEKVQALLVDMPSGFRLLTDLSGLESMDVACARSVGRIMDLCDKHGVEKVVRVIPDPRKDIGLKIMSLFHYRRDVRMVTCETLEEAKKTLRPSED